MKVLIVEDHLMFREMVSRVCNEDLGYLIVGEVGTKADAISEISTKQPDIVILDLKLPDGTGFDVMDDPSLRSLQPKFLLLSAHCDNFTVYRVERSRAAGFVDKALSSVRTLTSALASLEQGSCYFSVTFKQASLASLINHGSVFRRLSGKEIDVLSLIALSHDDSEIAQRLHMSRFTAKTHRSNILRKLNIPNTPKLIAFARAQGIVFDS